MLLFKIAGAIRPRRGALRALVSAALLSAPCIAAMAGPVLSGTPARTVTAAHYYAFQPGAVDTSGKALTFAIANKPSWASFDPHTGRLYGTPLPQSNVGTYANISISASDGVARAYLAPFSITVLALPNTPPILSGTPGSVVVAGHGYSFQPTARDPNGLKLVFAVNNKPVWANFNSATGALAGTPGAANAGTYPNILITAYDGYTKATLPAFSIAVQAASAAGGSTPPTASTPPPASAPPPPSTSTGSVTLSWVPPTQNSNGGVLTNLAGYHIYYGTSANNLAQKVTVANPGVARYVIGSLTPATWYFELTAYDTAGMESAPTGIESVIMQ